MDETTSAPIGVARLDLIVLDCPNPRALADFYSTILGWQIVSEEDDWVTIRDSSKAVTNTGIAFQLALDYTAPTWPRNEVPQQLHLDLDVADLDIAEKAVLAAGATSTGLPGDDSEGFRVYLDPVGHPFCLCK
jgi:catechol 2,3-dioxygenase-like lactoylglutathione lyase family enzyme